MSPLHLNLYRRVKQAFLLSVCLLSFTVLITAQEAGEPFRFGEGDLKFLDQIKQLDKKFEDQGLVYKDAEANSYLDRIGRSLLKSEDQLENVEWRFRILRDPSVNAFALPSGSIYVHTGLLARMEHESQLAAVLAHEIIHVRNRHTYRAFRSYRKKTLTVNLLSAAASVAGVNGLDLAAQFVLVISVIGYSRELEKEADLEGARLMLSSPYNAQAIVGALECLQQQYEVDLDGEPFYGDHPKLKDRISYLRDFLTKSAADHDGQKPDGHPDLGENREKYQLDIAEITRHNIQLDIEAGFYRTAVTLGKRLVEVQPNAANLTSLADATSALGPRPFEPTDEEKSKKGKGEARKRRDKFTLFEQERALAATSAGGEMQKANYEESEKLYRRAIESDPGFALAWRGLGALSEKRDQSQNAIDAYRKYIELQPGAMDRLLIMRRIKNLEAKLAPAVQKQP
jgi:beta-barrel assembly-enhancing protease